MENVVAANVSSQHQQQCPVAASRHQHRQEQQPANNKRVLRRRLKRVQAQISELNLLSDRVKSSHRHYQQLLKQKLYYEAALQSATQWDSTIGSDDDDDHSMMDELLSFAEESYHIREQGERLHSSFRKNEDPKLDWIDGRLAEESQLRKERLDQEYKTYQGVRPAPTPREELHHDRRYGRGRVCYMRESIQYIANKERRLSKLRERAHLLERTLFQVREEQAKTKQQRRYSASSEDSYFELECYQESFSSFNASLSDLETDE